MKNAVLMLMKQEKYKSMDTFELSRLLLAKNQPYQELTKALYELEKEGLIYKNKKGKYNLIEKFGFVKGILDLKQAGFGFIKVSDTEPDIFIPRTKTLDALDKDLCLVKITHIKTKDKMEGEIIRVIERHYQDLLGEYYQGAIFLKHQPSPVVFKVTNRGFPGLVDHTLVKGVVLKYHKNQILDVKVTEVLGHMTDPGVDILEVITSHNLSVEFPDNVKQEVNTLPTEVQIKDMKNRKDLRNDIIFTIDGSDTKDIDDAISIEKPSEDLYRLKVHIADVSYYVKEGSYLDQEAYLRGTSVYLADRVIPMLPRALSNGICSLNPNVDRLTITCEMDITPQGEVVSYQIFPSLIHSRYQMTYQNVNLILSGDEEVKKQYQDILESITIMQELALILSKTRTEMGSINFETIEPKIIFDEDGNVKDITIRNRGMSEKMIEEFMLVANQVVATHFDELGYPFLYRIHEEPDKEKLLHLFSMAKELNYIPKVPKKITHHDLQKLLQDVEDTKYDKVINMLMLRSMAKAKYSDANLGHYGLSFENYTHFTSPIRRYPDLIVHRLIRTYLFYRKTDDVTVSEYQEKLSQIGINCSKAERTAMICEREVMDMKKAEYMIPLIGTIQDGVVSSLTKFGMFVELVNTVEGLIHISNFNEAIEFQEDKLIYLGISSRKEYTIGMELKVKVENVNKVLGRVDFSLV